jgi:hypothetical protein
MIEVSLLVPKRVWTLIQRYAQEAIAGDERQEGDPERMAALLLEQLVENEEIIRRLGRSHN